MRNPGYEDFPQIDRPYSLLLQESNLHFPDSGIALEAVEFAIRHQPQQRTHQGFLKQFPQLDVEFQ
jgi:hypothetical protein